VTPDHFCAETWSRGRAASKETGASGLLDAVGDQPPKRDYQAWRDRARGRGFICVEFLLLDSGLKSYHRSWRAWRSRLKVMGWLRNRILRRISALHHARQPLRRPLAN